jgi:hypothetical protein
MSESVTLSELRESDLEEMHRFLAVEITGAPCEPRVIAARSAASLWYLFDNPETTPDLPKGWIARDARGNVVGTKICSPQRFRVGDATFLLLLGGGYYVNRAHRGTGLRLMQRYLALGDRYSHFATTMNEVSGAIYERHGGYPIPDSEHEMLGVLRWPPLVEEVLARRLARPGLARTLARGAALRPGSISARAAVGELGEISDAAQIAGLRIETPPEHAAQIAGARQPDFLRWRYFAGPDRTRALFVYTDPGGGRALVGTKLILRGGREQIRALTVLDYWGRVPDAAIASVAAHLAGRFRTEADVIVFRGQPAARRRFLAQAGYAQRVLPRAVGVCIDRAGRLPTREWYLVPADGDMAT